MSDGERESKLLLRAEALVAVAPLKEPNWDTFAARIEGALGLGAAPAADDSLLLPPLPESAEDGVEGAPLPRPIAAEAPGQEAVAPAKDVAAPVKEVAAADAEEPGSQREGGLAELARAALARRGKSEAVDLAKESLAIAAQGRGSNEQKTQERAAVAKVVVEPTIVTERERRTAPPVRRNKSSLDTRGPWIGVAIASIGLAAGFGLYLSSNREPQIVQVPVAERALPPVTPTVTALAQAPSPPVAPEGAPQAATPEVTPDMLPAEKRPVPEPVAAAAGPQRVALDGKPVASGGEARTPRAEQVELDEERPAKGQSTLASKPSSSAGMRPAEFNANGGTADRPSTGAAQAAVGAVLGAARSCIAGQPQASSATIQFGSGGEVTSVSVSGPAQGTPAAACIQSALQKARVQPFAAPTFSLAVTIRPH